MEAVAGVGSGPGKGVDESHDEVDQGPANDDVVVGHDVVGGEHRGSTHTGEAGMDTAEHTDVTTLELLAEGELHKGHGDTDEEEANEVGDEEESTTPSVAQVGEAPEVTEADGVADHGEDEGRATHPTLTLLDFALLFLFV